VKYSTKFFIVIVCVSFSTSACGPQQDPATTSTASPVPTITSLPATNILEPTDTTLPTLTPTNSPTPTAVPPPSGDAELPDVVGLTLQAAKQLLTSTGFVSDISYRTGQDSPLGAVVEQRPAAEEILQVGMVIRLYVSAELITISVAPGLEVGRNTTFSYPIDLDAGVPYFFYTQDTFNITDKMEWGPVFNCCGRMSIAPVGINNAALAALIFVPEEDGNYTVVINNNNPVRFSFTLVVTYFSIGE